MSLRRSGSAPEQVHDEISDFLETFAAQTSSDGGHERMSELRKAFDSMMQSCKTIKLHLCEGFLVKALKQHQAAVSLDEGPRKKDVVEAALRAVTREMSFLTSNPLGLSKGEACKSLMKLAEHTLA